MQSKEIVKFFYEMGQLSRVKREGWRPGDAGDEILSLWHQIEDKNTEAGIIAKDADLLELAVRAREYIERGYTDASEWFEAARQRLKTKSAKELLEQLPNVSSSSWWHGLKKID